MQITQQRQPHQCISTAVRTTTICTMPMKLLGNTPEPFDTRTLVSHIRLQRFSDNSEAVASFSEIIESLFRHSRYSSFKLQGLEGVMDFVNANLYCHNHPSGQIFKLHMLRPSPCGPCPKSHICGLCSLLKSSPASHAMSSVPYLCDCYGRSPLPCTFPNLTWNFEH